jgi:hypothetical protein
MLTRQRTRHFLDEFEPMTHRRHLAKVRVHNRKRSQAGVSYDKYQMARLFGYTSKRSAEAIDVARVAANHPLFADCKLI